MPLTKVQSRGTENVGQGSSNLIINGAMTVSQKTTSDSSISDNEFVVDRYALRTSNSGWYSAEQSTDAPTGFSNSLKITSTGANSPSSSAYIFLSQKIEGFNTAFLEFGTSNAKTVTLSFHVKSSLTGNFAGSLRNDAQNRSYPFTFAISSANTFEYKTITITGDTSGTWIGSTNGNGLEVIFNLGSGTNNQGTAGAWASSGYLSASGVSVVNIVETNGATFFLTGLQLEHGSQASDFQHEDIGTTLNKCYRYFQAHVSGDLYTGFFVGAGNSSTRVRADGYQYFVTMRTAPSLTISGAGDFSIRSATNSVIGEASSISLSRPGTQFTSFLVDRGSGVNSGEIHGVVADNTSTATLFFSSEL